MARFHGRERESEGRLLLPADLDGELFHRPAGLGSRPHGVPSDERRASRSRHRSRVRARIRILRQPGGGRDRRAAVRAPPDPGSKRLPHPRQKRSSPGSPRRRDAAPRASPAPRRSAPSSLCRGALDEGDGNRGAAPALRCRRDARREEGRERVAMGHPGPRLRGSDGSISRRPFRSSRLSGEPEPRRPLSLERAAPAKHCLLRVLHRPRPPSLESLACSLRPRLANGWMLLASAGFCLLLAGAIAWALRKRSPAGYGLVFFLVGIVPVSGLVPIQVPVLEHRLYLPMVGVALAAAAAVSRFDEKWSLAVTLPVLAVLAFATSARLPAFHDDLALWSTAIERVPDSAYAHHGYALALARIGRDPEAIEVLRAAIRLDPGFDRARYELALALGRTGQREQAIATIQDLLHRDPKDVDSWNALAFLWKQSGDLPKCKDALEQGLRIDPQNAVLLENLGDVLTGEGDIVRARSTFEDLVRLHPQNAAYRQKLDRLRGRDLRGRIRPGRRRRREGLPAEPHRSDLSRVRSDVGQHDARADADGAAAERSRTQGAHGSRDSAAHDVGDRAGDEDAQQDGDHRRDQEPVGLPADVPAQLSSRARRGAGRHQHRGAAVLRGHGRHDRPRGQQPEVGHAEGGEPGPRLGRLRRAGCGGGEDHGLRSGADRSSGRVRRGGLGTADLRAHHDVGDDDLSLNLRFIPAHHNVVSWLELVLRRRPALRRLFFDTPLFRPVLQRYAGVLRGVVLPARHRSAPSRRDRQHHAVRRPVASR